MSLSALLLLLLEGSLTVSRQQCPAGSVPLMNGYRCTSNVHCQNMAPGYYCYWGVCCSDGSDTVNTVSYGGYCTMTVQCSTPGAACISHICRCPNASQYNGYSCISTSVRCPPNQISINGQCYRKVSYGFLCHYTEQCGYVGAFCAAGICRCQLGYAFDGGKCVSRFNVCPGNQVAIGGRCYALSRMGEPCAFSQQCVDHWFASLQCINGYCVARMHYDSTPVCKESGAEVEYANGTVKNCLYWPCTVGYFCEYNESYNGGQYICCGINANKIYGNVKVYPGTNKPVQCAAVNSCTFVDTPNCVMSHRFGYKVCCSTMNC